MPTPMPAPILRLKEIEFDDEPTFATPVRVYTRDHVNGTFVFGGQTLPISQRLPLAQAIQNCFDADFSTPVDPAGWTVNAGAFPVVPVLDPTGEIMESIKIGSMVYTLGFASSLRAACIADASL